MSSGFIKSLLVAVFSLVAAFFLNISALRAEGEKQRPQELDPAKVIMEHVSDAPEFHFATVSGHEWTIPLPVILYRPGKGLSVFMASQFHHGKEVHDGYRLLDEAFMEEHHLAEQKNAQGEPLFTEGKIYATDDAGLPVPGIRVYNFSITRNVAQMLLSGILLCVIMIGVAGQYAKGQGVRTAPKGFQNAIEPVVTFVRDEVAKPNLGDRYERYMPYLLTVFFFILLNSLLSLIPGTANVAGNIAFTAMLGMLSFILIMFSSNKHYWAHIINPPVPGGIKLIMIPIEIMEVFTKPFALIIRLFANMISGHIIILSFIVLIFIFGAMNAALGWGTSPLFVLFAVFIYMLEILVAFIQAFIFANLTAVFIGQAFAGGHEGDHGQGEAVAH